jgi:phosphoglucomutase/phosphomannomutase
MDKLARVSAGFQQIDAAAALKDRAFGFLRTWVTDPDFAAYQPQLDWLIDSEQWLGLLDRFCRILPFGTGGRRGAVGIGPNRMNLWTLGASVQGHCQYLMQNFPGVEPLRVVLAYDVRRFQDQRRQYNPQLPNPVIGLSSRDFARHAACVYAANCIEAYLLPADSTRYLATPELSFAVRRLSAHGGLNISASHNPPDDNGGKFYDERGGQPVPPEDQIMADIVDQVTIVKSLPWTEAQRRIHPLTDVPHKEYIDLCRRQSMLAPPRFDEFLVAFTPLHGVGSMTACEALQTQGFRVVTVTEQMTPDGQFPNVTKSPNPEVPESMDRAVALARDRGADLVLATDPDADRLGAMAPDRTGQWHFITGNQIAALVTHFKMEQLAEQGRMPASPIVVKTMMTTNLITRIARHFGAQVVEDLLVGFKYIADVLRQLEEQGRYEDVRGTPDDFVIGCEESHGLLVTSHIRDKDAGAAALVMAECVLAHKRRGQTVAEALDALWRKFGYFYNDLQPLAMTGILGQQNMARMLDRLRSDPPRQIGGLALTQFEDLRDEAGRFGPIKGATDAASRNVLVFQLGPNARVALRPSGTEPKAKAYVEVSSPPCGHGTKTADWEGVKRATDELGRRVGAEFVKQALATVGA